jgi:hypothetical protein
VNHAASEVEYETLSHRIRRTAMIARRMVSATSVADFVSQIAGRAEIIQVIKNSEAVRTFRATSEGAVYAAAVYVKPPMENANPHAYGGICSMGIVASQELV